MAIKAKKGWTRKQKRLLFCSLILAVPILQFILFYVYVNLNSILLAFQTYERKSGATGYNITFAGFDNFVEAFHVISDRGYLFTNSLIHYFVGLLISMPLSWLLSYYIYKKGAGAGFFKVILYLPHILSSVVFVSIYRFIVTDMWMELFDTAGLLSPTRPTANFWAILFYNFWIGLGGHFLLYLGSMNGINESIIESAELDGVNRWQEFFHIILPMIYPTIVTFVVIGLSGVFTNQRELYTFFEQNAVGDENMSVIGYFLYVRTLGGSLFGSSREMSYGELSALGIMFTAVVLPLTLGVKRLMEKKGPSVD